MISITPSKDDEDNDYYSNRNKYEIIRRPSHVSLTRPEIDILQNTIDLPDDSLADPDLKDHDVIDSIMYIYYGGAKEPRKAHGEDLIVIGSILNCILLILLLFFVLWKKDFVGKKKLLNHVVGVAFANMFAANLVLMFGVYATFNHTICTLAAMSYDYFHTSSALWILFYTLCIYRETIGKPYGTEQLVKAYIFIVGIAWNFIYLGCALKMTVYEIKDYCFTDFLNPIIEVYGIKYIAIMALTLVYMIKTNIVVERYHRIKKTEACGHGTQCYFEAKLAAHGSFILQLGWMGIWFNTLVSLHTARYRDFEAVLQVFFTITLSCYLLFKRKAFFPKLDIVITMWQPQKSSFDSVEIECDGKGGVNNSSELVICM